MSSSRPQTPPTRRTAPQRHPSRDSNNPNPPPRNGDIHSHNYDLKSCIPERSPFSSPTLAPYSDRHCAFTSCTVSQPKNEPHCGAWVLENFSQPTHHNKHGNFLLDNEKTSVVIADLEDFTVFDRLLVLLRSRWRASAVCC